jgi:hypothetical protein
MGITAVERKELMSRPIEANYASYVAYTRALEEYCDSLAQPEQQFNFEKTLHWHALNYRTATTQNAEKMFEALERFVAQPQSCNFCSSCGKRLNSVTDIHTCTPPQENI